MINKRLAQNIKKLTAWETADNTDLYLSCPVVKIGRLINCDLSFNMSSEAFYIVEEVRDQFFTMTLFKDLLKGQDAN